MSFSTSHAFKPSSSYSPPQCRQFTLSEIEHATQNFDESLVIGRGGFGKVYRGTITYGEISLDAAIKRLESGSNQGAVEFWAEVEMLSKLRHSHLVSLIGYCKEGQEMILVYEYMRKGTLADRLHKRRAPLTWVRRLKICIGAARGLDYLHTDTNIKPRVIHRDVKSSNILLDDNWAAKISDFGLSKIGPTNQPSTYVNTLVRGTFGYLDPDYFQTGRLTRKSDVYAFGVVLLEVLCGKQAVDRSLDEEHWGLVRWAQDSIKEGKLKHIVDSALRGKISPKCLKEFSLLAKKCLHSHPKQRPTMAEVVMGLESILALLEKTDSTLHSKLSGRRVLRFLFPFNRENSVGGTSLQSLDRYLCNVGGEDRIVHRFDVNTIVYATENFSEANKIYQGCLYDSMYKGRLQNGHDITITQYSDARSYEACKISASILVKFEHENAIQLLGYCIEGTSVYLIFDYAFNVVDQLSFRHNGKHENIPVIADMPAENPVSDAAIEFDMLVKMIWFLLRVQSNDGDDEN
ncbi:receptor-like protein kinase ANXUR2 isoform X1 [Helianthus annuus]|uniref:receptor-like protein kinase ANXUR2 isoform X1 n=1 Tax=Helianthus annuus TaxID=4232 RepID=UPI000B8F244A|nr:receptor-like protein kinase ANXUR2 isoform X1 [Helianthus annuus]